MNHCGQLSSYAGENVVNQFKNQWWQKKQGVNGGERGRGQGERSPGDLRPAAAVPIEDGADAGTHLGREDRVAWLVNGKERSGLVFCWAANFSILKIYSLSAPLSSFQQNSNKSGIEQLGTLESNAS
jgi:hypothetical protein